MVNRKALFQALEQLKGLVSQHHEIEWLKVGMIVDDTVMLASVACNIEEMTTDMWFFYELMNKDTHEFDWIGCSDTGVPADLYEVSEKLDKKLTNLLITKGYKVDV